MTQIVPVSAYLGPARTGQAIGYRVLALDGTTLYSAFTTTGVVESPAGSGDFHVNGGVVVPDAGGYIVVGLSGTDIKRAGVDPVVSLSDVADAVLGRAGSNVDDSAGELSLYHLIMAILNGSMQDGAWTALDTTGNVFATRTLELNAAAIPVVGVGE
jgi:hypothetical protein